MAQRLHEEQSGQDTYWQQLSYPWQCCIEEAWAAYGKGSLPIGAVITDASNKVLARGRNRIYEDAAEGTLLHGHRLAHAEMNALISINWRQIDPRTSILYTTTEPCPLCVGAVRLTRLGAVSYASRDCAAGSIDLFAANEFMRRGRIKIIKPHDEQLEIILTAMLLEKTMRLEDNNMSFVYNNVAAMCPTGAELGQKLFDSQQLQSWSEQGCSASFVVNQLIKIAQELLQSTTEGY